MRGELRHDGPSIAVAQTMPVRGDVQANTREHLELARIAGDHGAQVVVFPELSLTGYELDLAEALAFSEDDARLRPLHEAARASRATLIVGAPFRFGPALHIGAFILSPTSATAEVYTKQHLGAFQAVPGFAGDLPPAESTVFRPGPRNPRIRVGDLHASLAICADVGHPTHAAHAAERGDAVYLASMFVLSSDLEPQRRRLADYATTHEMVCAMANFGGPSGGLPSAGRTCVWDECGTTGAELSLGSGVVIATRTAAGWRAEAIHVRPS